jgi:TldD protein
MKIKSFAPAILVVAAAVSISFVPSRSIASGPAKDALLESMQHELQRATSSMAKSDPAPYYMSYTVTNVHGIYMIASNGAISIASPLDRRQADVIMRVGAAALDNTHNQSRPSGISTGMLPLADDPDAIARSLWSFTDAEYQQASAAFLKVKTNKAVQSAEEDQSPDFSVEPAQTHLDETVPHVAFDLSSWEDRLRRVSGIFLKYPEVYGSGIILQQESNRSYLAASDGTALVQPSAMARMIIQADTRADDGMELMRVDTFQAPSPADLPSDAVLEQKVTQIATDLKNLRAAPLAEPYAGPALLSGRAAAVFFHEVLGHRLEGHRQRSEQEGQTFTKKVGQKVLPTFLTVIDDPTMKELGGIKLAGTYAYDDEGDPAQRVVAVENGILRNFLMSRMPIQGFDHTNGHGRRQPGLMPTGRQGNLIVSSTNSVKDSELWQRFQDEIKKSGKPYGLYFDDIEGGFTLTTRSLPQAFQVIPVMVYRVYPDGRKELVRGVDIVGTPLLSLNNIILTGDTQQVFNGVCGAESGWVPVAAAAPAMLFSEIEVQKRQKGTERPPILPPPDAPAAASTAASPSGSNVAPSSGASR